MATPPISAADQPQWGQQHSRNMVSSETNLPTSFDLQASDNVRWVAQLGDQTYSTPVVASGRVLIGTNNANPRDPRRKGDLSILLCLDEATGDLQWQLACPKLSPDPYTDWPGAGICSTAAVESDRVYIVSNRGVVLCLDLNGLANGNDGPFRDEAKHLAPAGTEPVPLAETDADIIWLFDMHGQVGIHQHDSAHSSILLHDRFLYVNTSNGLNSKHSAVFAPDAPSLIVLDKHTGRLLATDNENIGPRIFHCTWSSPALGRVGNSDLVFFAGGDGVVYAFQALTSMPQTPRFLDCIWRFDCDPNAPKENVHDYIRNRRVSPSNIKSMPVFHNNRIYVTVGGDIWWGKRKAWLKCIDAAQTGDITRSAELFSYDLNRHCCSTPSICKDMLFVADTDGFLHCLDAITGKPYWMHDTGGEIWASTLVADEKVYIGTRKGDLFVFAADKNKQLISSTRFDSAIIGTPTAANGTLYIPTMKNLYALAH